MFVWTQKAVNSIVDSLAPFNRLRSDGLRFPVRPLSKANLGQNHAKDLPVPESNTETGVREPGFVHRSSPEMCEVPLAVEDSELIDSYRATGCRDSLDELARRYLGRMRNVVYQMVLDDEAADDLTQEVMLRALRGLANFNGQAAFSTWIYRIAMNTVYSFLAQRLQSPLCFPGELPEPVDDAADSPERAAMRAELDGRISQALNNLSPKLRAAIVLTTLHDWSPAEAAEIEGCSTGTMYWRIHEAREQLQGQLATWLKT